MEAPKRYHPALVTLHWLVALLVFTNLYLGLFQIRPQLQRGGFRVSNSIVNLHMAVGVTILVLIIIRFIVRFALKRPDPATAGNKYFDITARVVHYGLYLFVFAATIVGLIFSLQTNRFQRAFLGARGGPGFGAGNGQQGQFPFPGNGTPFVRNGTPFPRNGTPFPGSNGGQGFGNNPNFGQGGGNFPRGGPPGGGLLSLHLFTAITLLLLLVVHISAAFYHQFVRKDHLWSRMWYGAG
jgi:cytochrome b561